MTAHKGPLFAEMGIVAGDSGLPSCAAKAGFPFQPVYTALSGTKSAAFHQL